MIRRLLPWPILSAFLLAMWLLLNQTVEPAHILLGAILAIALPLLTAPLRPVRARLRNPAVALRLTARVAADSFMSGLDLARIILGPDRLRQRSGFVQVPLDLRDPHGVAVLALILTAIPGTVWNELSDDGATLTIHVLDLADEDACIRLIKTRYERPLMEIFE